MQRYFSACFIFNYATIGIAGGSNTGAISKTSVELKGLAPILGSSFWLQASGINLDYPYLKNNVPN